MDTSLANSIRLFFARHPLVPAAAMFLLGVVAGRCLEIRGTMWIDAAVVCWIAWLVAELVRFRAIASISICAALMLGGAAYWNLNQWQLEPANVARFAPERGEVPIVLRAAVIVAPESDGGHGNQYWLARVTQIWTDGGWRDAAGNAMVKWSTESSDELRRGARVELNGWLARPEPALNPGAFDQRRQLATDRVFAQIRVPRQGGLRVIDDSSVSAEPLLPRFRNWLREKLLLHTVNENVPAAYTLSALILGQRTPATRDVSQAFADAGVAHLLAISGSHTVLFAAMVWSVLRYVPLRPRRREVLMAAIVGLYIAATPLNPPIERAAVGIVIVLLARLLGRPRQYLNMLAVAAIVVILLRPADIADAGFQLTFLTTAGLVLFSERIYAALFARRVEREALAAELSRSRLAKWRWRATRYVALVTSANLCGALMAAPLVAFHFGQVNPLAMFSGMIAMPAVGGVMITGIAQLIAEFLGIGAMIAPLSTAAAHAMIALVKILAAIPGAAASLRAPPVWGVVFFYVAALLWSLRKPLNFSRAMIANTLLAVITTVTGWYALTAHAEKAEITILSAGGGSAIFLQTPDHLWCMDAGRPDSASSVATSAIRPAMQRAGSRRLDGLILTALDTQHARDAGEIVERFHPKQIWTTAEAWQRAGQTLAGENLKMIADREHIAVRTISSGQAIDLGDGCQIRRATTSDKKGKQNDAWVCDIAGRHVCLVDPKQATVFSLTSAAANCDAVVFSGLQRGDADGDLIQVLESLGTPAIIWSGRGPWAPRQTVHGQFNAQDGAVLLRIDHGVMHTISLNEQGG